MSDYTYTEILTEYRLQADNYDPWGSAMGAWFDVAAELYRRDPDLVPLAWEYRPGAYGISEPETYFGEICAETETDALVRLGRVLDRYCDKLRVSGRDY